MSTERHEGQYREEIQLGDRFDPGRSVKGGEARVQMGQYDH
jgi:hypothetical protein